MPSKGTTKRNIRISDELWAAALEGAAAEGTNVSALINDFLCTRFMDADERPLYEAVVAGAAPSAVIESLGLANLTRAQKLNALRNRLVGIDNPIERFAIEKQIELLEVLG